jgi:hypothetical protein
LITRESPAQALAFSSAVHISEGERYSTDFTPDDALRPDEKAVLLYDASSVDGDRIIDLSGKNNHGTVE